MYTEVVFGTSSNVLCREVYDAEGPLLETPLSETPLYSMHEHVCIVYY